MGDKRLRGVSRVGRLWTLGGAGRGCDGDRRSRMDGGVPGGGRGKTGGDHCNGSRGGDKPLGRRDLQEESRSGYGGGQTATVA